MENHVVCTLCNVEFSDSTYTICIYCANTTDSPVKPHDCFARGGESRTYRAEKKLQEHMIEFHGSPRPARRHGFSIAASGVRVLDTNDVSIVFALSPQFRKRRHAAKFALKNSLNAVIPSPFRGHHYMAVQI